MTYVSAWQQFLESDTILDWSSRSSSSIVVVDIFSLIINIIQKYQNAEQYFRDTTEDGLQETGVGDETCEEWMYLARMTAAQNAKQTDMVDNTE